MIRLICVVLGFFNCGILAMPPCYSRCTNPHTVLITDNICIRDTLTGIEFTYPNICGLIVLNCLGTMSNRYQEIDYYICHAKMSRPFSLPLRADNCC
uniref:Uncharacterized protein n=1 Tax=Megaselia scalaris TaxID=36166 RepID=T1GJZ8_MEGSC